MGAAWARDRWRRAAPPKAISTPRKPPIARRSARPWIRGRERAPGRSAGGRAATKPAQKPSAPPARLALSRLKSPLTAPALGRGQRRFERPQPPSNRMRRCWRNRCRHSRVGAERRAQLNRGRVRRKRLARVAAARHTEGRTHAPLLLYRARIAYADRRLGSGDRGRATGPTWAAWRWRMAIRRLRGGLWPGAGLDGWRPDAYLGLAQCRAAAAARREKRCDWLAARCRPRQVPSRRASRSRLRSRRLADRRRRTFSMRRRRQAHPGNAQAIWRWARTFQAAGLDRDAAEHYEQARQAAPGMAAP